MTAFSGNGIALYRLLAGRMVMRLAAEGIKGRSTAAWAKRLRLDCQLPPRAPYALIAERLDTLIEATGATHHPHEVTR